MQPIVASFWTGRWLRNGIGIGFLPAHRAGAATRGMASIFSVTTCKSATCEGSPAPEPRDLDAETTAPELPGGFDLVPGWVRSGVPDSAGAGFVPAPGEIRRWLRSAPLTAPRTRGALFRESDDEPVHGRSSWSPWSRVGPGSDFQVASDRGAAWDFVP
jgi:hypothetical protein